MYKNCIKRLLDILLSLTGIILLSWLYLILFILVRVDLRSLPRKDRERMGKFSNYINSVPCPTRGMRTENFFRMKSG